MRKWLSILSATFPWLVTVVIPVPRSWVEAVWLVFVFTAGCLALSLKAALVSASWAYALLMFDFWRAYLTSGIIISQTPLTALLAIILYPIVSFLLSGTLGRFTAILISAARKATPQSDIRNVEGEPTR